MVRSSHRGRTGKRDDQATPEEEREIQESRITYRDHEFERVVDVAVKYHAEESRTDNLHEARRSKLWGDLHDAIKAAYEAQKDLRRPISADELDMHRRMKAWQAAMDATPRRRSKRAAQAEVPSGAAVIDIQSGRSEQADGEE